MKILGTNVIECLLRSMWYLKQIHTLAFDSDGCNLTSDLITTLSRAALSTLPCQMEVTVLFELNNYQISGQ